MMFAHVLTKLNALLASVVLFLSSRWATSLPAKQMWPWSLTPLLHI